MACPERPGEPVAGASAGAQRSVRLSCAGGSREVALRLAGSGRYHIVDQGHASALLAERLPDGGWLLIDEASGRVHDLLLHSVGREVSVLTATTDERLERWEQRQLARAPGGPPGNPSGAGPTPMAARVEASLAAPMAASIATPMPGRVAKLLVRLGDQVAAGQAVAAVEAMKMENELCSPRAGRVTAVLVDKGDHVEAGQALLVIA